MEFDRQEQKIGYVQQCVISGDIAIRLAVIADHLQNV